MYKRQTLHYVHATNEVLKRLLVNALGIRHLAATSAEQWLGALDTIVGDCTFSEGHGKIFGAQRFSPQATADVEAVHQIMQKLLARVHPTRTHQLLSERLND